MSKTINGRIIMKHDTTANWTKATNFKPLAGEIIIYDADETHPMPRIKIGNGDGETNINDLPFQPDRAIIDVSELPTDYIDENNIYRLNIGHLFVAGARDPRFTCLIVNELPDTDPLRMMEQVGTSPFDIIAGYCYYNLSDNEVYGYFTEQDSWTYGTSQGWNLMSNAYFYWTTKSWGGVIENANNLPQDNKSYIAFEYELYWYKGDWYNLTDHVGWHGTGEGAELFNYVGNEAEGQYAHAEGYGTHANELATHAEGHSCQAIAHAAHAEGEATIAAGAVSHAEGFATKANGNYSHSEGIETIAAGEAQHVQGKYNIVDTQNKYAHIVGNGIDENNRSNAHTVDWDGNAWFAGSLTFNGQTITDIDSELNEESLNPVQNKTIVQALTQQNGLVSSIISGDLTKNRLEFYSPDKIKVDFANTSNGWKLQLGNNATPDAEIDTYITHNNQDWQQHEVGFTTGASSTIDAQFVKWSQGKDGFLLKDVELLYANGDKPENLVESATSIEEAAVYYDDFSEKKAGLNLYKNSTVSNGQLHLDNQTASAYGLLGFYNMTLEPNTSYVLSFDGNNIKNWARMLIYEGHYNWGNTVQLGEAWITSNKQYSIAFTTKTSSKISIVFTEWDQGAFHMDVNDLRIVKPYIPEINDFIFNSQSGFNSNEGFNLIYRDGPTTGVVLAQANVNGFIPNSKYVISFDYMGGFGATYLQIGNNSNLVLNEGISIGVQGSVQFVFTPIATSEKLAFITFDTIGCTISNLSIYPTTESLGDIIDVNNSRWSILDDNYSTEGILLDCHTQQFFVGAKALGIAIKPNTDYKLCFKTKRINTDYSILNWQDYTTFGDDDKIALVSNLPGYESLQLGGPWVGNVIKDDHRARMRIYPAEDQLFLPKLVSINATLQNVVLQTAINFYASGQLVATLNAKTNAIGGAGLHVQTLLHVPIDVYTLPFGKGINGIPTLDYIEIIFEPSRVMSDISQTIQSINHISIYGTQLNDTSNPKDNIHQDAYKHTYFPNRVVAPVLVGELDDGSLDWRNL